MTESTSVSVVDRSMYGSPKPHIASRYKLIERIGSGGYGVVFKSLHIGSNTLMAMKLLRRDPTKGANEDAYRELLNISEAGRHANIAPWYDYVTYSDTHNALFMELFDTDLWDFIKSKSHREIFFMIDVALQSMLGLAHLHSRKPPMIHRDIKPQNILIKINRKTNTVVAKLSDFGISNILESSGVFESATMEQLASAYRSMITTVGGRGTILFLASEFFAAKDGRGLDNGRFRIDPSVDIFAMGLVYLYMFCYNTSDYGM